MKRRPSGGVICVMPSCYAVMTATLFSRAVLPGKAIACRNVNPIADRAAIVIDCRGA